MLDRITAKSSIANGDGALPLLAADVPVIVFLLPIAGRHRLRDRDQAGKGGSRMLAWIKRQDGDRRAGLRELSRMTQEFGGYDSELK